MDNFCNLFLKKQLVLDVCEPHIKKMEVNCHNNKFSIFKFGSLELGDEEYIFGTEQSQYEAAYSDSSTQRLPIIIAKKRFSDYVLTPLDNFSSDEQDMLRDAISYTLEVQQAMSRYMLARC